MCRVTFWFEDLNTSVFLMWQAVQPPAETAASVTKPDAQPQAQPAVQQQTTTPPSAVSSTSQQAAQTPPSPAPPQRPARRKQASQAQVPEAQPSPSKPASGQPAASQAASSEISQISAETVSYRWFLNIIRWYKGCLSVDIKVFQFRNAKNIVYLNAFFWTIYLKRHSVIYLLDISASF